MSADELTVRELLDPVLRKIIREEMQAILHEDRLLTAEQAAEMLGYSDVGSVHRLAREGHLERINLGENTRRFRSSDVQRIVQQGLNGR